MKTAPLQPFVARWADLDAPEAPGSFVVPAVARAIWLAGRASEDGPVLAIVAGERDAEDLVDDLELFTDRAFHLPAWETLPFEHVSPTISTMAGRVQARHVLRSGAPGSIVVASVRAAVQRISPSPVEPLLLGAGDTIDFDALVRRLAGLGYERTDRVEARGEMAVRGGIIDLYPTHADRPVRIDFWGDDIDEITEFSVATQRSVDPIGSISVFPAREVRIDDDIVAVAEELRETAPWAMSEWDRIAERILFQGVESWLPWLTGETTAIDEADPTTRVVVFEPSRVRDRATDLATEEAELAAALAATWGPGAPAAGDHPALYLPFSVPADRTLEAPTAAAGPGDDSIKLSGLDAAPGDAESLVRGIGALIASGTDVVIAMDGEPAADRVARVLGEAGLTLDRVDRLDAGSGIISVGIHRGFVLPDLGLAVLGEQEIAGRRRAHRRVGVRRDGSVARFGDLSTGDFVVHRVHGIGRFEGLVQSRASQGSSGTTSSIAYHGAGPAVRSDRSTRLQSVKYTGGESPRLLSRMGGADWETDPHQGPESGRGSSQRRSLQSPSGKGEPLSSGTPLSADTPWQREFEAAFPFEETPDQLTAIADVKRRHGIGRGDGSARSSAMSDSARPRWPLRAAFKAVQSGQARPRCSCPTTLLAQQHYADLRGSVRPVPSIRVEMH